MRSADAVHKTAGQPFCTVKLPEGEAHGCAECILRPGWYKLSLWIGRIVGGAVKAPSN